MQATFFQKVLLTMIAGLIAASLIWFYKNMIQKANEDINVNWRTNSGQAR
ncbi:MAG: hypothetical protein QOD99_1740 [Chthoniobacter sp.]|jgi:hypothetical protein|nr:hypothetical protein [Chthoniobacter sp.]